MPPARSEQLNLRLAADEAADMREAAADAGLSLSEWARLVLRHASGRHQLSEHMADAAKAGAAAVHAAIGAELAAPKRKRARAV